MFGILLPSVSDATRAVTGAASSALHTTEDLGSAAVSHAASLGRAGLDLGRSAVTTLSHVDVQKLGSTAIGAIGHAQAWAENGIRSGVMQAGQGVHAAADYGRSHITGSDPLLSLARGAITYTETQARFDLGVVGGVGTAAVGLVGSAGQLGVMAAERQLSPAAAAAQDAKIGGAVLDGVKAVAGYADSVAHDPSRVLGDVEAAGGAVGGWVEGEVASAEQAVAEGHGPESFGMVVGNLATYAIPVGGEVRAVAGVGETATRGLAGALTEDAARTVVEDGARAATRDAGEDVAKSGAEAATRDAGDAAARTAAERADPVRPAEVGSIIKPRVAIADADAYRSISSGTLAPDTIYTYAGREFETDALGRSISTRGVIDTGLAGQRIPSVDLAIGRGPGAQAGDVGFHRGADVLGFPGGRLNVNPGNGAPLDAFPGVSNLNGGAYKTLEGQLRRLADTPGNTVTADFRAVFEDGNLTSRPDAFAVIFEVNSGPPVTQTFLNRPGG